MQKHVNLVDLVKSFPTDIYLQNLASIQKRASPIKFAHLAEKSEKSSISNLSTKPGTACYPPSGRRAAAFRFPGKMVALKCIPQDENVSFHCLKPPPLPTPAL